MLKVDKSFCLSSLSPKEIEKLLGKSKTVIIPLGGLEPLSDTTPLGIIGEMAELLAGILGRKHKICYLPVLPFGNTSPFGSFLGVVSLKRSSFEKIIRTEILNVVQWGVKKILLINFNTVQRDLLSSFVKGINRGLKEDVEILVFDAQNNSNFKKKAGKKDLRLSKAILSLAMLLKVDTEFTVVKKSNEEEYFRWFRGTRDPELFKKLFPRAVTSNDLLEAGIELGEQLLELSIKECEELIFMGAKSE